MSTRHMFTLRATRDKVSCVQEFKNERKIHNGILHFWMQKMIVILVIIFHQIYPNVRA